VKGADIIREEEADSIGVDVFGLLIEHLRSAEEGGQHLDRVYYTTPCYGSSSCYRLLRLSMNACRCKSKLTGSDRKVC